MSEYKEIIKSLKPKKFKYYGQDKLCYGFIAQEMKEVLPEAVVETPSGYLAVEYHQVIPILVKVIQEMMEEIERLKEKCDGYNSK